MKTVQWLTVSDLCPLCKTTAGRVLYDIKSAKDYSVHVHHSAMTSSINGNGGIGMVRDETVNSGTITTGGLRGMDFRAAVYRRGLEAQPPEPRAR